MVSLIMPHFSLDEIQINIGVSLLDLVMNLIANKMFYSTHNLMMFMCSPLSTDAY